MKAVFVWLLDRLQEKTTWYGMISIAASIGLHLDPELEAHIIQLAVAAAGTVAFVTREK